MVGPVDNGSNCSYDLELTANVVADNTVKRVVFTAGTDEEEISAGGGNNFLPQGSVSFTFTVEVDCPPFEPSISASIYGYANNGNGNNINNSCGGDNGTAIPGGGPLPVELISFTAALTDQEDVLVEWLTASEENNDYFELQHSINGRDFESIAKIEGNGTTDKMQYYKYVDNAPERGNNYYRIKQVDFDGKFELFDMAVVKIDASTKFKVFPSQTYAQVVFETPNISEKDQIISIYNDAGVLFKSSILRMGEYKLVFDVQDFPSGIYFIQFVNELREYDVKKFVKLRD